MLFKTGGSMKGCEGRIRFWGWGLKSNYSFRGSTSTPSHLFFFFFFCFAVVAMHFGMWQQAWAGAVTAHSAAACMATLLNLLVSPQPWANGFFKRFTDVIVHCHTNANGARMFSGLSFALMWSCIYLYILNLYLKVAAWYYLLWWPVCIMYVFLCVIVLQSHYFMCKINGLNVVLTKLVTCSF